MEVCSWPEVERSGFRLIKVFCKMGASDDDTLMLFKTKYLIRSKLQLVLLVLVAHTGVGGAATAAEKVSFNRQIQPILSEYCYHCHGPDSATRKPKKHPLRLD